MMSDDIERQQKQQQQQQPSSSSNNNITQGAYNSQKPGKHGNLREFVNSGKLREFKIYSGNLSFAI